MIGTDRRSVAVRHLGRVLPAISPRARARLLAGFLGINLLAALLAQAQRLGWLGTSHWLRQLDSSPEGTLANSYSVVVWSAVAVLALAQLCRSEPAGSQRRLQVFGWLCLALIAALAAFEEGADLKDSLGPHTLPASLAAMLNLEGLPGSARWLPIVAPLLAVPLAAGGWVLLAAQRGHPARTFLVLLAGVAAASSIAQDAYVTSGAELEIRAVAPGPEPLHITQIFAGRLEEGAEVMAAAALVVVLIEMLATRSSGDSEAQHSAPPRRLRVRRGVALVLAALLLTASVFPLLTPHTFAGQGWRQGPPRFHAGPISLVEQRFRANHDNLRRIDVWAYADVGSAGRSAEIFARLTPVDGSDRPIRESRANVGATRLSNATVALEFEPIPDSGGRWYTLAVGVLSGPTPYVFLGLTDGDMIPEGSAVVNGATTPAEHDLALRTSWNGRFVTALVQQARAHWLLIGEVSLYMLLWVAMAVATWLGLSGPQPHFWRGFLWPTVINSALITAGIWIVAFALLAVRLPT